MLEDFAEKLVVPEEGNNRSAYDFLKGKFNALPSRKSLKKAFSKQLIFRNQLALNWDDILSVGDKIQLKKSIPEVKPYHFDLHVSFQDHHIAVLWKPAGISVSGNVFKSIRNMLPYNLTPSEAFDALPQPEPVHRLDKPTSGWLIVAKTFSAAKQLGEMFQEKTISKTYLALVHGCFNGKAALTSKVDDKLALTKLQTVEIVKDQYGRMATLLEVTPVTGRKHQIRVHLSGIGFPIFGDKRYQVNSSTVKDKGLFLCAAKLSFEHPLSAEYLSFTAPLPKKFTHKLKGKESII